MKTLKRSLSLVTPITLAFLYSLAVFGCAELPLPPALPAPLSEDIRGQFGRIGIVSAHYAPELIKYEIPAKGLLRGTGRGVAEGALAGAAGGILGAKMLGLSSPFVNPFSFLALLLLTPVGAVAGGVAGGVHGAATAESATTIEQGELAIKKSMETLQLNAQTTMGEHVLQEGIGQAKYSFSLVPKVGPQQWGEKVDLSSLRAEGIDTVLEVSVVSVGLWEIAGYYNAPFQFQMNVHTYLTRTMDRNVLWEHLWSCQGRGYKFIEWGADDARLLREEIDHCFDTLAHNIVYVLFVE